MQSAGFYAMQAAGQKAARGKKEAAKTEGRSAEQPGQAINVDVCYVPTVHTGSRKLPAVSGSSGHLVVERLETEAEAPAWPGQLFADPHLDYMTAMTQYAAATRERLTPRWHARESSPEAPAAWRQAYEIRQERYEVRQRRKAEDQAWRACKAQWRATREAWQALAKADRIGQAEAYAAAQAHWQRCRTDRQDQVTQRVTENHDWHASLAALRATTGDAPSTPGWIAMVVITDNCTRQCLGLPAFTSGAHLTSEEVVQALRTYLPSELAFLISDQGSHFRNKTFAQLAQDSGFVHVPVYRHRPESNGIVERLIRTLKEELREASWKTYDDLTILLADFQTTYNDRPHQGLPISGLSPNEFAKRIWLM